MYQKVWKYSENDGDVSKGSQLVDTSMCKTECDWNVKIHNASNRVSPLNKTGNYESICTYINKFIT